MLCVGSRCGSVEYVPLRQGRTSLPDQRGGVADESRVGERRPRTLPPVLRQRVPRISSTATRTPSPALAARGGGEFGEGSGLEVGVEESKAITEVVS